MAINLKREEEEIIFKKRLFYDGQGSGEDKRLVNLIKNITKFCLGVESNEDLTKLYNMINKDLAAGINTAEKNELISKMYDSTFKSLDKAIEDKTQDLVNIRSDLANLQLELEYAEKLKKVNAYPDSQTTETAMQEIEIKKKSLMDKIERQKDNLRTLLEACKSLQKVLEDDKDGNFGESESCTENEIRID